jgi:hypothetical protein
MTKTTKTTDTRNGFRRPTPGSVTAMMWDAFDAATGPIVGAHLKQLAELTGWNLGLLRSHFRQWRGFNA